MAITHDNCKGCHSQCEHAGKDREFVCINGVSCKFTEEKPKTNADRIRAMSDEELASFLESLCHRLLCDKKYFLEWLKQPAEEET